MTAGLIGVQYAPMPERTPKFNVSFTLVKHRDDACETRWTVEGSSQEIVVDSEFFDTPDIIANGRDAFGRRLIGITGVPQEQLAAVLDAREELGGFLDMRGQELLDEITRRLRVALGMPTDEEADDDA